MEETRFYPSPQNECTYAINDLSAEPLNVVSKFEDLRNSEYHTSPRELNEGYQEISAPGYELSSGKGSGHSPELHDGEEAAGFKQYEGNRADNGHESYSFKESTNHNRHQAYEEDEKYGHGQELADTKMSVYFDFERGNWQSGESYNIKESSVLVKPELPSLFVKSEPPSLCVKPELPSLFVKSEPPSLFVKSEPPSLCVKSEPPSLFVKPEPPSLLVQPELPSLSVAQEATETPVPNASRVPYRVVKRGYYRWIPVTFPHGVPDYELTGYYAKMKTSP